MKKGLSIFFCFVVGELCFGQANWDSTRFGFNQEVGRYANIRGFKMYYEIYGVGQPMLMIHSNGGSMNDLFYQAAFFSKKFRVIMADSRAQGKSFDESDSLSYEMMADDMNALLEFLRVDSCFVLGWSDGGINGLLLAIRHPKMVKKLAITGANLWPDSTAVDPWIVKNVVNMYDSVSRLVTTPRTKNFKKLLRLPVYEPHIKIENLQKLRCPTLVISGDHDVILPRHSMLIAESIPNSYLWVVANSGHSIPLVYQNEFNKVVMEFFSKPFRRIQGKNRFN